MPELHESFVNRDEHFINFEFFIIVSNILMLMDAITKTEGRRPPSSNFAT